MGSKIVSLVVNDQEQEFIARPACSLLAALRDSLGQSADRQAVLARFVGSVDADEARLLRELLAAADPAHDAAG